uniref:Uncharacterized protein n=1 Tax=Candidatus Kentrum sp. LPFa TaxID=2126335 RepID=A0A450VPR1_9GAMM|nr:MAG: hypothetical protein BECKLPF1236A_GA0070988_1000430 [Candidatus Kentron sp. LPFa]
MLTGSFRNFVFRYLSLPKPEPKIFIYNSFRHSLDKRESSNQYFLNDHVEGFITPADEKRARVGWMRFAYPPYGPESSCCFIVRLRMHKISPSGRDDIFFIHAMEFRFRLDNGLGFQSSGLKVRTIFRSNMDGSLGDGKGDDLKTAATAERSNAAFPLLSITDTSMTSPVGI